MQECKQRAELYSFASSCQLSFLNGFKNIPQVDIWNMLSYERLRVLRIYSESIIITYMLAQKEILKIQNISIENTKQTESVWTIAF